MEIELVAVVLLFPVFVPVSVPVFSESVAVPVFVSVFESVFVPVVVPVEVLEAVEASVVGSEVSAVVVSEVSARLSKEPPRSSPWGGHGQADDMVPSNRMVQSTLKMKHRMSKIGKMISRFEKLSDRGITPWAERRIDHAPCTTRCDLSKKEGKASKRAYRFGFGTKQFRLLRKDDQKDVECRIWY
jgi:hypothetical protein